MKKITLLLAVLLAGCQKQVINPVKLNFSNSYSSSPIQIFTVLLTDTVGNPVDRTILVFKNGYYKTYLKIEDAIYFQGFGRASLSSLSSDSVSLAINDRPLILTNDTVLLNIHSRSAGHYKFHVSSANLPNSVCFLDHGKKFNLDTTIIKVDPADTYTFGYKRFKLIFYKQ